MRYKQGWQALNRLLHEDGSFSGHERNCVFLNTGQGGSTERFADVSAATGLDFDDDGRAVAATDWDFDGDQDLWITNRTAPRVRFMRNDCAPGNHFLSVKLRGDGRGTNRDAVGARVELILAAHPQEKLIKTLHAGDGFLSQSSNWMHFGLGSETKIERLVVHWPGGNEESYDGFEVDARYVIDQQTGEPVRWQPPSRKPLVASDPQIRPSSSQARIVLPARLSLPTLKTAGSGGALNSQLTGPTLINLWSTTCQPCLEELAEWSREAEQLNSAGLDVVAVNLDNLAGDTANPDAVLARLKFPFRSFAGTHELVDSLDFLQRAVLDRWQPLPVPASFLVDRNSQVSVIYKGRVQLAQVLADLELLDAPADELRKASTPFSGRWIHDPPTADPLRVAIQFIDHAMIDQGLTYLQQYAQAAAESATGDDRASLGDTYYVLAVLLREQDQADEALAAFRQALQYSPDDFRARNDLASLLAERGQLDAAAGQLAEALRIQPDDVAVLRKLAFLRSHQKQWPAAAALFSRIVETEPRDVASWFNLAGAQRSAGRISDAVRSYRQTLQLAPDMTPAANNLAWILATHPDDSLRDGPGAVRLAEAACRQTGNRQAGLLDTLAAAYAETGAFDQAIDACQQAIALLNDAGKPDQVPDIEQRMEIYRRRLPYRDPPESP